MYKNLHEFIKEYDDIDYGKYVEKHIGIEFEYNNKFYRMCNEPIMSALPKRNGIILNICTYTGPDEYYCSEKVLGWYEDLNDCLENWIIDGKKLKRLLLIPTLE